MIILALGMLAAASCSTYAASRYIISADTTSALRAYRGQMVSVGPFTAPASPGRSEINCRDVKPIKTPDGEPFEEFIRKALVAELTIAEVYAPTAPVMLTGRLESIAFSSGTFPTAAGAAWRIRLVVASSNGRTLTVSEDYKFTSSYIGDVACNQTAHALMPAVQNLVGKIVRDPGFAELLSATLSLPAPFEEATAAMRRADYVTALRLLRPLAEQGYAPAQFDLGVMYTLGHGVFDYAEAVRWYRKAAEQGYAPAQWSLGTMYFAGQGVPQDIAEAMLWYRKAAEQGLAVAQDYLRKPAEHGYAPAQFNLGLMYETGRGVPQDYVQAHMWFSLAATRFSASETEDRETAIRSRDRVAAKMTAAQIAEAERLAREWKPK